MKRLHLLAIRGLVLLTTVATSRAAFAAPPPEGTPPSPPSSGTPPSTTTPPAAETPPAETPPAETPPAEDDWGDAPPKKPDGGDDDWGDDDKDEPWTGTLVVEDVSNDPDAQEAEKVEQVEVKGDKGQIKGVVKDTTSGDPLSGANVRAIGTKYEVTTDKDGAYVIELPPGTYKLEFYYEGFDAKEISNLNVTKDGSREQNVELTPNAEFTQVTEIKAEAPKGLTTVTLSERKEAVEAKDTMGREEMSKAGGGSTAGVARRIVASTIVGGRFLFIRGLGHRYGNTLMDGARVPSPEPDLRTVPLDIFPSSALSAIEIVKTFTPDTPADFAGGSTQLQTVGVPDGFVFSVGAEVGANTATTFQDFNRDYRFAGDAFGFGNLNRGLPTGLPNARIDPTTTIPGTASPQFSAEEIEAYGESFFMWTAPINMVAPPKYSVKANIGNAWSLGKGHRIGVFAAGGLKDGYQRMKELRGVLRGTENLQYTTIYNGTTDTRNTQWSGIGLVRYEAGKHHDVGATFMYSRDAENEVRVYTGNAFSTSGNAPITTTRHRYIMRSIMFSQLKGEHEFPKAANLKLDWFGSYSQARRDDPTLREMTYSDADEDGTFRFDAQTGGASLLFQKLVDDTQSGALNLTVPFKQWKRLDGKVKFGVWGEGKQRAFAARRFGYALATGLGSNIPDGIGNVITDDRVGGGLGAAQGETEPFFIRETTRPVDNYKGDQALFATYAMVDLPIVRWFKIVGGARFEHNNLRVSPFNVFDPNDPAAAALRARLVENDVFPSLSFIFSPTDKMNVRLVGTQTIARPEMRELAPFTFVDFNGGIELSGNPFLKSTRVWNADLRWELFPSAKEVVAVSGFFKYFDDPIERAIGQRSSSIPGSFINAVAAYNAGAELELRKNLEFLSKRRKKKGGGKIEGLRWLEDISVYASAAIIYSRVRLPTVLVDADGNRFLEGYTVDECMNLDSFCGKVVQFSSNTSRNRPLQGQSPYVVNAYISYDNDDTGTSARVLYNVFGRRIDLAGGQGLPDIYEIPFHSFDFVFSQRVFRFQSSTDSFEAKTSHEMRFNFGVENFGNAVRKMVQGPDEIPVYRARPGVGINVGLEYAF